MLVSVCSVGFVSSIVCGLKFVYDFNCNNENEMINGKFFIAMLFGGICGAVMFTGFTLASLMAFPLSMIIWFIISLLIFLIF